jgi:hypothetical protein
VAVEAELARLRAENARLLKLLRLTPPDPAQGAFFEAAPGIVHHRSPQDAKVAFFGALFAARTDVYAVRYDNQRTGKSGWIPAVRGGWRKGVRHEDRNYLPLTAAVLAAHLKGEAHLGLYPPGAPPAPSPQAAPATPGPATSNANEPSAAREGPPRADDAASGSRRPSTTSPAATGPAPTRPG